MNSLGNIIYNFVIPHPSKLREGERFALPSPLGRGASDLSSSRNLRWGEGDSEFIGRRIEPACRTGRDEVVKGKVF